MKNQIDLLHKFKGSREYIQGPDMFNDIFEYLNLHDIKNIRFSINSFITSPYSKLHIYDNKREYVAQKNAAVNCQVEIDNETHWITLHQHSIDKALSKDVQINRHDFNEEKILSNLDLVEKVISLKDNSPYSFIETVVSLKKKLLTNLYSEAVGQWVFTRIDLPSLINANYDLAIQFEKNLNFKLIRSSILVNNEKKGDIYFSLISDKK